MIYEKALRWLRHPADGIALADGIIYGPDGRPYGLKLLADSDFPDLPDNVCSLCLLSCVEGCLPDGLERPGLGRRYSCISLSYDHNGCAAIWSKI